jgi:transglutaminase-like putative cysteine protease
MNHRLTMTAALATLATSTALVPLISGGMWFWAGLGAIAVVAGTGTATRQRALRALPVPVCLLASLIGLLLYLNIVFAARFSLLRILPTGASMVQLWHLGREGLHLTQIYAQPVHQYPPIIFLAASGIGLVAVVTDLVAVRLRRCALAGLPLLVLFSVPIASGAGHNALVTGVLFCIGMAGYLSLLGADGRERLRLWGRLVSPWHVGPAKSYDEPDAGPNTRALAASGRRIGLAAVVLAIFTPLLIPGLHGHKLFPGHGTGIGTGFGTGSGSFVAPIAQMTANLRETKPSVVMRYHTSARRPGYLQVFVLTKLTTTSWGLDTPRLVAENDPVTPSQSQMPKVPGLGYGGWRTERIQAQISKGVEPLDNSFIPLPYPARQVTPPGGGWVSDPSTLMVYSTGDNLAGLKYQATSLEIDPTQQQFAGAVNNPPHMSGSLYVPPAFYSLSNLARQIVGKSATTPYQEALALQSWFQTRGHFTYSLNAPGGSGPAALKNFLENSKSGYCQQFAFAMAVLARLLGIPSRVAVGYTAGTRTGPGNYEIRTSDAHAWPELYFTGLGWLPWEPTPSGPAVGQGTAVPPPYSTATAGAPGRGGTTTGGGSPSTSTGNGKTGSQQNQQGHLRLSPGTTFNGRDTADVGANSPLIPLGPKPDDAASIALTVIAVLLGIGLVLLVAPRVIRTLTSRRRWRRARTDAGRAHAAWQEFLDDLADYGVGHSPGETPRAAVRRVASQLRLPESARQALQRVADLEERASYAREAGPSGGLPDDLATVRSAVAGAVSRAVRWRAMLLPASAAGRMRHTLEHALDVFDWLEVAISRLTSRLARAHAEG